MWSSHRCWKTIAMLISLYSVSTGLPHKRSRDDSSRELDSFEDSDYGSTRTVNRQLMEMLCKQSISSVTCIKRKICLDTGEIYGSTCEYYNAMCTGLVSSASIAVRCEKQYHLISCDLYDDRQQCPFTVSPVCGYVSGSYYKNECDACKNSADEDRKGDKVKIAEHKKCILDQEDNDQLTHWATSRKLSDVFG